MSTTVSKRLWARGPTTCAPRPEILKSIARQIKARGIVSEHELRIARRMGIIATDPTSARLGFNDGVIYPFDDLPGGASRTRGMLRPGLALAPAQSKKRKMHALALMVDFSDNKGSRPARDFTKLLFDKSNPDSMTNFYKKLSYGALDLTGEAIGYVRAPRPYSFYTANESGTGRDFPNNTPGLLQDALTIFCQSDDLKRFDVDGDGYVDGIFLIHAGGGAEAEPNATKRKHMIWSHKWTLPRPFVHEGVKVFAYSTEPEDGRVGVFSHEFGHVLGLPDLYDTTNRSHGVGDWCLMGSGSWGDGGNRPTRMSCWCLAKLKWIAPKVISAKKSVRLQSLESRKDQCYRVWTKGSSDPEYLLLENRQASGLDKSVPGSGLALWHIDERQSNNDNPLAYMVAVVQADGKKHLEFLRNSGDDADVFPGTKNVKTVNDQTTPSLRSNQGTPSRVSLTNIAQRGGVVTVDVTV